MPVGAWDIMIDDDTYSLLEEYYGRQVDLGTMISNLGKAGIVRLLDDIIEGQEDFPDDPYTKELATRAREAKRRLG